MEGQHQRAGVTGEHTDCCSILACGSSFISSLFSKRETDGVKTSAAAPPQQFLRWQLMHGSCCLPAACGLLLHPTLSSSRLSGYECGLPGHKRICVYAIIHLFVCIHEKTTQKPVLAHVARAGFREKLCAFICLCFLLCKQSCNGEAELSMEQFA